ncbi:hypothetical protein NQD34_015219 [Periophthalmus magnuspinnatus]|nr:hypothetical protein NQD34_015219 [Periophthalmus magnuspinnatus]
MFSKRLESATVVMGNAVKLQGAVKGSAPLSVKWLKDSELLRDDDPSVTMTFDNNTAAISFSCAELKHGGKYSCEVENEAGQAKCDAHLTVQEPARVLDKAASMSVTTGDTCTLQCTVSGSPELHTKWFKNGKELTQGRKYKSSVRGNVAVLKITSAETSDTGEYHLEVWNQVGKDRNVCSLSVSDRAVPPSFPKALQRVAQAVGGAAVLECRVAGSQPLTVSWFKDGREITKHERFSAEFNENTAVLTIRGLTLNDAGEFSCRAQNQAGTSQTSSELCVTETPVFSLTPPPQLSAKPGSDILLRAEFSGSAPLVVRWFKEQREVFPSPKASIRGEVRGEGSWSSLELHTVRTVDSGSYTCQVSNEGGKTLCSSTLSVQECPHFTLKLEPECLVRLGQSLSLSCKVQGSVSTVTWSRDGSKLVPDHNQTMIFDGTLASLNIDHCSEEDSGVYECEAQSEAGSDQTHCHVRVQAPPVFTKPFASAEFVRGAEMVLCADVSGSEPFEMSFYLNEKLQRSDTRRTLKMEDGKVTLRVSACESADSGAYRVLLTNQVGECSCTSHVTVTGQSSELDLLQTFFSPLKILL